MKRTIVHLAAVVCIAGFVHADETVRSVQQSLKDQDLYYGNITGDKSAETSAAISILIATQTGVPVSTTHCINACIMGVGASQRISAVRWGVAGNIVTAWVLTLPIAGAIAFVIQKLLDLIGV